MKEIEYSIYQRGIFDFVKNGEGNLVINAVAGSGKTFTILHSMKHIPKDDSVLMLAFNKHMAVELKTKLISMGLYNIEVKTLHSLGSKALWDRYNSKMDNNRVYNIIRHFYPKWKITSKARKGYISRINKLVGLSKLTLATTESEIESLANRHEIFILDREPKHALKILNECNNDISTHDFNDMLYRPVKEDLDMVKYDWVFIDECQDLAPASLELVMKSLSDKGRFIAVGDPKQAIYSFAGSDINSFNKLTNMDNTTTLSLNITYRCPKKVVEVAKELVSNIEPKEDAIEGVYREDGVVDDVVDGDMVLCRFNRPLVTLCIKFIREGKKAYMVGNDVKDQLINLIDNSESITLKGVLEFINLELKELEVRMALMGIPKDDIKISDSYLNLQDNKDILSILGKSSTTVEVLKRRINVIFTESKDGIVLSSVHKSKGLENDRIFIVEPSKLGGEEFDLPEFRKIEEKNIEYVAYTRAKKELIIIPEEEFTVYDKKES